VAPVADPSEKATDLAGTFINALATIATGALVFGIGLVSVAPAFDVPTRIGLVVSWAAFAVSILGGLFAQATIPMHVYRKISIFDSPPFEWPVRVQQIAFGVALLLLAVVLTKQLLAKPVAAALVAPSATEAFAIARRCVALGAYDQLARIELLPADDSSALDRATWHLQLQRPHPPAFLDLFVDAGSGSVTALQAVPIAKGCRR